MMSANGLLQRLILRNLNKATVWCGMLRLNLFALFAGIWVVPGLAYYEDIAPSLSSGVILTNAWVDPSGPFTANVRTFAVDFYDDLDDPFFAGDPGFNAQPGSGLPAGSQLRFNILSGGQFDLPANLSYWSGAGPVAFGFVPNNESLRLTRSSFALVVGNTLGSQAGFNLGTIASDGSMHQHLFSFLRGADGNTIPAGPGSWGPGDSVQATDGIYLVSLELTSSNATIIKSQPLFVLFNSNLSDTAVSAAADWVNHNLVVPSQWATVNGGAWGNTANWSGDLPNSNQATARLWGNLTSNGNVDLQTTDRSVKAVDFDNATASYTISSSGGGKLVFAAATGNASLTFTTTNTRNHTISAPVQLDSPLTIAAGSQTITLSGQVDFNGRAVTLQSGTVKLVGNAVGRLQSLTIANNGAALNASPPYSGSLRTYDGTLDLAGNSLVVDATPLAEVADMIRSGRRQVGATPWTGTGIISNLAATGPRAGNTSLGAIRNVTDPAALLGVGNGPLYANFNGVTLTGDEILVKYTWYGDFDLDGKVTSFDFALLDAGFAGVLQVTDSLPGWYFGDADYNGVVDSQDYSLALAGYNAYVSSGNTALPEPGAGVLALIAIGLISCYRIFHFPRRS